MISVKIYPKIRLGSKPWLQASGDFVCGIPSIQNHANSSVSPWFWGFPDIFIRTIISPVSDGNSNKNNVLSMQLDTKQHFSNIGTESKNKYKTQVFYNISSCFIAVKLCPWVLQLCPGWPQGWPLSIPRKKTSAHTNSRVDFLFGMRGSCKNTSRQ